MLPTVSIVIPAYNAEKYIEATINSILKQTYTDWELIIIDDGANDDTSEKIKPFLVDKRIKYFFQNNQGVSIARNNGINKATGKYISFIDADDIWLPENLEEKINFLERNPEYAYVFSDMYESDGNLENIQLAQPGTDKDILKNLLLWEGAVIPTATSNMMIRKSELKDLLFDINLSTGADVDFTIQLSSKCQGKRISKPLIIYRRLNQSMSKNISAMEHDFLYIYKKAEKENLYKSGSIKKQCFANMYLILAGSWWLNGNNKKKAIKYIILSLIERPSILLKLIKKVFK